MNLNDLDARVAPQIEMGLRLNVLALQRLTKSPCLGPEPGGALFRGEYYTPPNSTFPLPQAFLAPALSSEWRANFELAYQGHET